MSKSWALRSRSHIFDRIFFTLPRYLERWCTEIPLTTDGPSKYVRSLYFSTGTIPFVNEPQALDPYLAHFSALTRVRDLTLVGYRDEVQWDMVFQCFSGFKNNLLQLQLKCNLFGFNEISRMIEFFPNIQVFCLWGPGPPKLHENGPSQPPRQASFPGLTDLHLHMDAPNPLYENHIFSGFAKASMPNLEALGITGKFADPTVAQELLDSTAQTVRYLGLTLLGKPRLRFLTQTALTINPSSRSDLDLSSCRHIEELQVHDLVYHYTHFKVHDSLDKPIFNRMLSTLTAPILRAIIIPIISKGWIDLEMEDYLPDNDWADVDLWLGEFLARHRLTLGSPSWTFVVRIVSSRRMTNTRLALPIFSGMGGRMVFLNK